MVSCQSPSSASVCSTARASGRSVWRHSNTIRRSFAAGSNSVVSTPSETIRYAPGKRTSAAAAVPSETASSWSILPRSRSRCARPGGYPRRSGEKNVATARLSASRSARYDRLGRPGSKPCTTSKRPSRRARDRFVRTPTGTPTRLRREIGTAGPRTTSPSPSNEPLFNATRPAARSAARFDDAMMVTAWPSARSSRAIPATCSFTSCGCDQANGVTRQIRSAIALRV
jgi:hypothetical protein